MDTWWAEGQTVEWLPRVRMALRDERTLVPFGVPIDVDADWIAYPAAGGREILVVWTPGR
ncbi:MAG: hypothetical protein AUI14_01965 [Actinobacteria bacterium 13_2_20CM_2_71_6]|nr:MAG: hypothetical protein AUI14_01965 [Actinobacteria bacterium 13_2_20CM_2_71_6]